MSVERLLAVFRACPPGTPLSLHNGIRKLNHRSRWGAHAEVAASRKQTHDHHLAALHLVASCCRQEVSDTLSYKRTVESGASDPIHP